MKRTILISIVFLQFIAGFFLLRSYYLNRIAYFDVLGVSTIEKEKLIEPEQNHTIDQNELFNFSHYTELKPGEEITEYYPELIKEEAIYSINNDGLNDSKNYEIEKKENVFRIVAIGDSFTFGALVSTKNNWTEQLEQSLVEVSNKCQFEVINLGMGAFDIPYLVKRYEDKGKKYDADLIFWFESWSGFDRMADRVYSLLEDCDDLQKESDDAQKWHQCWEQAQALTNEEYPVERRTTFLNQYLDYFFNQLVTDEEVVVFLSSTGLSADSLEILNSWKDRYQQANYIDTIPPIPDTADYRLPDRHPNSKGHEFIAQNAYEILLSLSSVQDRCF